MWNKLQVQGPVAAMEKFIEMFDSHENEFKAYGYVSERSVDKNPNFLEQVLTCEQDDALDVPYKVYKKWVRKYPELYFAFASVDDTQDYVRIGNNCTGDLEWFVMSLKRNFYTRDTLRRAWTNYLTDLNSDLPWDNVDWTRLLKDPDVEYSVDAFDVEMKDPIDFWPHAKKGTLEDIFIKYLTKENNDEDESERA